eukprot:TRINITY_DN46735_c0_g1_i1.p1 TRINITY_DN46735_c0_g1~~TRINITY_DN46735_c0_g1_i1.p1  ORF type:complete len:414 (+),score=97.60 TRINITY_DN46735_c0_g1_i1:53-1243(+)
MPYGKGGKRRKSRGAASPGADDKSAEDAPRSIIFCRGKVGVQVNRLMREWRQVMMPFTSQRLKATYRTHIKDIEQMAKTFQASGLHVFSCPATGSYLRLLKAPQGPTLSFRVESFILRKDVMAETRRDHQVVSDAVSFSRPPLCVLNGFNTSDKHLQLVATTFQNMFPTIHVDKFRLSQCRRVLLVNYNKQTDMIDIRHFGIIARQGGLSAPVKKLARGRMPKRVGELGSVDELFGSKAANYMSDTDGEGEDVNLPQNFKHLHSGVQTRLKLHEIGPRMTLQLVRVETGFWAGETVYHKFFDKTPEEVAETARRVRLRERLKQLRKSEQKDNVDRKRKAEEQQKQAKRRRRENGQGEAEPAEAFEEIREVAPEADAEEESGGPSGGARRRRVSIEE